MKKISRYILACVISFFAFASCDVHEFPEDRNDLVPFLLHLDFSTEMPLYKEIPYTRSTDDTKVSIPDHSVRYIVNAYRTDNVVGENRTPDTTFVFVNDDIEQLDYTARLELCEGDWTFRVWCDYVDVGSTKDKYYNTSDFSEIILMDRNNHSGSNDFRDAFRGTVAATVLNPLLYSGQDASAIDNQATAQMVRPMGKYKFVSTDVEVFITRVIAMMKDRGMLSSDLESNQTFDKLLQSINLGEYTVMFKYSAFMPCSFNMFTDKPADSWTNMTYQSRMSIENDNEMNLGFDYIFVNGTETTLSISVEVYNKEGELMSSTNPIQVPIVRSKITLVKGEFLTSIANGGVAINPGYDGEDYNIEIK